jgi:crossover junction endodeoxyribonuclease RuvC
VYLRALGIDPGTAILGYGLLGHDGRDYECLDVGVLRTPSDVPLAQRLVQIHRELGALLDRLKPDHVAVEELFFTRNAKTAFAVGHARGVILLTVSERGLPVYEYTPSHVKQALVGYGAADKAQVQQFLKLLLHLEEIPKPDDAADALAVAVCHCNSYRLQALADRGQ